MITCEHKTSPNIKNTFCGSSCLLVISTRIQNAFELRHDLESAQTAHLDRPQLLPL